MPWFPLSDDLNDDPRYAGLSDSALALWTRAASWSARRLTDGHVPTAMVARFTSAGADAADELVQSGAWTRARAGWQMTDFPASAKKGAVEARRASDRRRQQDHRRSAQFSSHRDTQWTPDGVPDESNTPYTYTSTLFPLGGSEDLGSAQDDQPPPGEPQPRRRTKKRPIPLPADWEPTERHVDFAKQNGLDLTREAQNFRWNAEAKALEYASWNAAFSTWLGKSAQWKSEQRSKLRSVPSGEYWRDSSGRRTEIG